MQRKLIVNTTNEEKKNNVSLDRKTVNEKKKNNPQNKNVTERILKMKMYFS